jgi:hypothetical protein
MSRNYNFTPFNYGNSKQPPQQQKQFNYGAVPPPGNDLSQLIKYQL